MPLPLHRARLLWSFFQRWFLELLGAMDWVEIYQPIMDGRSTPSESSKVTAAVTMGAFLTSVRDCEHFFKAGLPFWLVRSSEHHPTCRIDEEVAPTTPQSLGICTDDIMSHKRDTIYHGPLRDIRKATTVEQFGLAIVEYTNDPFAVPTTDLFSMEHYNTTSFTHPSSSPAAGPSRAKKKTNLHQPYDKNRAKRKATQQDVPQIERDKFAEIHGPYSPDIPDVWVQGRSSIDRSRQPSQQNRINRGYAFPDPGYILNIPPAKMRRVLETWIRFYPVLTFRYCLPAGVASSAWSPKQWRILLGTTDDYRAKEGSQMADRRNTIKDLLGQCLDFHGLKVEDTQNSHTLTWREGRYNVEQLSEPHIVRNIVWELFELNFRFEFHSLDRKFRAAANDLSFNDNVQACFPNYAVHNSPTQIDSKKAHCGLAAEQLRQRGSYFRQMCYVMKDWPGGAQANRILGGKRSLKEYTDDDLTSMERWATKFYCQTFYEAFGRPPILPHRVDPF
ncbi:hypothetical protein AAF712_004035 [Marasmius tenuissimus]|uniref:Uncharacterized protein n=1 Tax=Marasmius tenuissimus TaxID=585030 RepID=A0ABR3A672_9AGAR